MRCYVEQAAFELVEQLRTQPLVQAISYGGEIRRKHELVDVLHLVVATRKPEAVVDAFLDSELFEQVLAVEPGRCAVRLRMGKPMVLHAVNPEVFIATLVHITGSDIHIAHLRKRARKMGLLLLEDGLFDSDSLRIMLQNEEELYSKLNLPFIPAELREDGSEIKAALENKLPNLVESKDIKGLLHVHTVFSDGIATIAELAGAALLRGYEYIGICDHSAAATAANGMSVDRILQQHAEIDELQEQMPSIRILKGVEVDILPNGHLDYNDAILARFDFAVASIHSGLSMNRKKMTERLLRAMDNPLVTIIGHPTGRLLPYLPPYELDFERVFAQAAQNHIALELNAHPLRLDLNWRHIRQAREFGVKIAINPDAHSVDGLDDIRFGVETARKAWIEPQDVINTMTADDFLSFATRKRSAHVT